ncbi:MAG: hypothetical protein ACPKPY_00455 [Nitrososphaeraceae archaeon]
MDESKFFSIQHAQSGSISEVNATAYLLELNDISYRTILFSDKPNRIVKSVSTLDFIENWTIGENNFAIDPPTAVLVVDEQEQDVAIVELFNPVYDIEKKTLKYNISPDNLTSIDVTGDYGQNILLIDPTGGSDPTQA